MKICKFSGETVSSADKIKDLVGLIGDGERRIIVFSAVAGVREHLESIVSHLFNRDIDKAHDAITKLEFVFVELLNGLLTDDCIRRQAIDYMLDRFQYIWKFTKGTFNSTEEKEIVAQGSIVTTALVGFYLKEQGIGSCLIPAVDFMRTGFDGKPDMTYIKEKLNGLLAASPDTPVYITQGSLYRNAYNEVKYFEKGGNDLSASLIGAAVDAEEIQLWADSEAFMDNKVMVFVSEVKQLSYEEEEELAYYENGVPNPESICPARERHIPVRLLNLCCPADSGILISDGSEGDSVKAVVAKDSMVYLKFESNNVLRSSLFLSKVFETFAKYQTPVCLVSTSSVDISMAIERKDALLSIVREMNKYATVKVEDRMSIISVIGSMRWQCAGLGEKIFRTLKEIPVRMISYGGSNCNVSFIVRAADRKRVMQLI